jgi:hypothetical protein
MNAMSPRLKLENGVSASTAQACARIGADMDFILRLIPGDPTPHSCRVMANTLHTLDTTCLGEAGANLVALEDALNERALSLPVSGLDDVAALLALATTSIEMFTECVLTQEQIARESKTLRRILISVLPFLLKEGMADAGEVGCSWFLQHRPKAVQS